MALRPLFFKTALVLIVVANSTFAQGSLLDFCKKNMGGYFSSRLEKTPAVRRFRVNGIRVTGDEFYPLPVIQGALGLNDEKVSQLKGQSLLSLGEGYSQLLPYLISQGVKAIGLDQWYGQSQYLEGIPENEKATVLEYERNWAAHLVQGSATHIPFLENSFDHIVSHRLVDHLSIQSNMALISEALRVVKNGGEVDLYMFKSRAIPLYTKLFKVAFGPQATFEFSPVEQSWTNAEGPQQWAGQRLSLTKRTSKLHVSPYSIPAAPSSRYTM